MEPFQSDSCYLSCNLCSISFASKLLLSLCRAACRVYKKPTFAESTELCLACKTMFCLLLARLLGRCSWRVLLSCCGDHTVSVSCFSPSALLTGVPAMQTFNWRGFWEWTEKRKTERKKDRTKERKKGKKCREKETKQKHLNHKQSLSSDLAKRSRLVAFWCVNTSGRDGIAELSDRHF